MRRRRRGRRNATLIIIVVLAAALVGGVAYLIQVFNPCKNYPFAPVSGQSLVIHNHDILQIYVNGFRVTINNGIGGGDTGLCTQPVHNHGDHPDVIHIESPTFTNYTLGDYFKVWAGSHDVPGPSPVLLNRTQIFGNRVGNGNELRMYVNGQQSNAFDSLILTEHQVIVIVYGSSLTPWSTYQNISSQSWPYSNI